MKCPRDGAKLTLRRLGTVAYHRCPRCRGAFYQAADLRLLKNRAAHGDYRWINIDLWRHKKKFRAGKQERLTCPQDGETMLTLRYGESRIRIDICGRCKGIWLDAGELDKILRYLEHKVDSETVSSYVKDLRKEVVDAIKHPTRTGADIADIAKILHLLELRFVVQHPTVADALERTTRGIPGA